MRNWAPEGKKKIKKIVDMGRLLTFENSITNWWVRLSTDFEENQITGWYVNDTRPQPCRLPGSTLSSRRLSLKIIWGGKIGANFASKFSRDRPSATKKAWNCARWKDAATGSSLSSSRFCASPGTHGSGISRRSAARSDNSVVTLAIFHNKELLVDGGFR